MKSKSEKKEKNLYTIVFIVLLILVSIAYASLVDSLGAKVTKGGPDEYIKQDPIPTPEPTPIEPDTPEPVTPVNPKPKPTPTPTPTPDPDPPKPPIIDPIRPPVEPSDIDWIIEFDNIKEVSGSVTPISPATIDSTKLNINFDILLKTPGEYYSFTADIVNSGSVDAKIYQIVETGLTARQRKFLKFEVKYADGTEIKPNDTLLHGEKKKIKVTVKFKDDDITAADLPTTRQVLNLSYKITYIEKE